MAIRFTFNNLFRIALVRIFLLWFILFIPKTMEAGRANLHLQTIHFQIPGHSEVFKMLGDPHIYTEGWDKLPQPLFWQEVVRIGPETSIINKIADRTVLGYIPTEDYESMTRKERKVFSHQLYNSHAKGRKSTILITSGKADYYQFRDAIPMLGKGIDIFLENSIDPWYAQAILLVESPGRMRKSVAGARGAFQLMPGVAISQGLRIDAGTDERIDFVKSAHAAANYIKTVCVPETKIILDRRRIRYNETDLWFKLMVMHVYHAGMKNVEGALQSFSYRKGGFRLLQRMWRANYKDFGNASQNYSQLILACMMELDRIVAEEYDVVCPSEVKYNPTGMEEAQDMEETRSIAGFFKNISQKVSDMIDNSPFNRPATGIGIGGPMG